MTLEDRASLTIGPNQYDFLGNIVITTEMRTGFLVGGGGSSVWSFVGGLAGVDDPEREGIYFDLGGGAFTVQIEFEAWEGARDSDGNAVSWGGHIDESPITQRDVLLQDIRTTSIDSTSPAQLAFGEFSGSGMFSPLDVVLEQPTLTQDAQQTSVVSGSITCISAADVREAIDAAVDNQSG